MKPGGEQISNIVRGGGKQIISLLIEAMLTGAVKEIIHAFFIDIAYQAGCRGDFMVAFTVNKAERFIEGQGEFIVIENLADQPIVTGKAESPQGFSELILETLEI